MNVVPSHAVKFIEDWLCSTSESSYKNISEWKKMSNFLASLENGNIRQVILQCPDLLDVLFLSTAEDIFESNVEIWSVAVACLRTCTNECGSLIWQVTSISASDFAVVFVSYLETSALCRMTSGTVLNLLEILFNILHCPPMLLTSASVIIPFSATLSRTIINIWKDSNNKDQGSHLDRLCNIVQVLFRYISVKIRVCRKNKALYNSSSTTSLHNSASTASLSVYELQELICSGHVLFSELCNMDIVWISIATTRGQDFASTPPPLIRIMLNMFDYVSSLAIVSNSYFDSYFHIHVESCPNCSSLDVPMSKSLFCSLNVTLTNLLRRLHQQIQYCRISAARSIAGPDPGSLLETDVCGTIAVKLITIILLSTKSSIDVNQAANQMLSNFMCVSAAHTTTPCTCLPMRYESTDLSHERSANTPVLTWLCRCPPMGALTADQHTNSTMKESQLCDYYYSSSPIFISCERWCTLCLQALLIIIKEFRIYCSDVKLNAASSGSDMHPGLDFLYVVNAANLAMNMIFTNYHIVRGLNKPITDCWDDKDAFTYFKEKFYLSNRTLMTYLKDQADKCVQYLNSLGSNQVECEYLSQLTAMGRYLRCFDSTLVNSATMFQDAAKSESYLSVSGDGPVTKQTVIVKDTQSGTLQPPVGPRKIPLNTAVIATATSRYSWSESKTTAPTLSVSNGKFVSHSLSNGKSSTQLTTSNSGGNRQGVVHGSNKPPKTTMPMPKQEIGKLMKTVPRSPYISAATAGRHSISQILDKCEAASRKRVIGDEEDAYAYGERSYGGKGRYSGDGDTSDCYDDSNGSILGDAFFGVSAAADTFDLDRECDLEEKRRVKKLKKEQEEKASHAPSISILNVIADERAKKEAASALVLKAEEESKLQGLLQDAEAHIDRHFNRQKFLEKYVPSPMKTHLSADRSVKDDSFYCNILKLPIDPVAQNTYTECTGECTGEVPCKFDDADVYVSRFQALLLGEVRAAVRNQTSMLLSLDDRMFNAGDIGRHDRVVGVDNFYTIELNCIHGNVSATPVDGKEVDVERLMEAQYVSGSRDYGLSRPTGTYDLKKDDLLVMIRKENLGSKGLQGLRDVLAAPAYQLALVTGIVSSQNRSSYSTSQNGPKHQKIFSIVMARPRERDELTAGSMKKDGMDELEGSLLPVVETSQWMCVPFLSLSTFFREWNAVAAVSPVASPSAAQGVHGYSDVVPLLSYVLTTSPSASVDYVSTVKSYIVQLVHALTTSFDKMLSLRQNREKVPTQLRHQFGAIQVGIRYMLYSLEKLKVNEWILSKSGIGKTVNSLKSNKVFEQVLQMKQKSTTNDSPSVVCGEIIALSKRIIQQWKLEISLQKENKLSVRTGRDSGALLTLVDQCESSGRSAPLVNLSSEAKDKTTLVHLTNQMNASELDQRMKAMGVLGSRGLSPVLWTALARQYNNVQCCAIAYVVGGVMAAPQDLSVSLIQGPPGTGKTSTILGLLSALLYLRQDIPHSPLTKTAPIVLCAPSNTAVDELLKRLHVHGVHNAQGNRRTSLKLVRLGKAPSDKSVTEDGKPSISVELSLDAQVNVLVMNSPRWKELQTATRTITECQQKLNALKGRDSDVSSTSTSKKQLSAQLATARLTKLRSGVALDNIRLECRRQVLLQADIIVGTLSSLGAAVMLEHVISENIVFDTVIIDEAAQATEPSTLIPLRYGCRHLVLIGDPRQLAATVLSKSAGTVRHPFETSLFERFEIGGHHVVMLNTQYRMHPEIRMFSSSKFYGGQLVDAPGIQLEVSSFNANSNSTNNSCIVKGETTSVPDAASSCGVTSTLLHNCGVLPMSFFDLDPRYSKEVREGKSLKNPNETVFIISKLKMLIFEMCNHYKGPLLSMGVISPYKAQVFSIRDGIRNLVQQLTNELGARRDHRTGAGAAGVSTNRPIDPVSSAPLPTECIPSMISSLHEVEVNTVDGFQGRELDIVVYSTVRSSLHGELSFVSDERRINVALTRARKCVMIVGCTTALSGSGGRKRDGSKVSVWHDLIAALERRSLVMKV